MTIACPVGRAGVTPVTDTARGPQSRAMQGFFNAAALACVGCCP